MDEILIQKWAKSHILTLTLAPGIGITFLVLPCTSTPIFLTDLKVSGLKL